jgi:para-nitrobenzyl esterase
MSRLAVLLLLLLAVACKGGPPVRLADPASRRTTPTGEVEGFVGDYDSYVWLGLPYASPPVGDLRWRAPTPPAPWQGVRKALAAGSPCIQYASPFGGIDTAPVDTPVGDEDCLYLNVYAPRSATITSFLPVMVWIHGGGNTIGAGTRYDGGHLAASQNVVVVTVNYRLGPFGWFRNAALRTDANTDAERSGNFAILDLVRALEWVEGNIANFGGDPAHVTIFGESAGGSNTLGLLLSPSAVGLFHRAIVQSAGFRTWDPVAAEAFDDHATIETTNSASEAIARLFVADGSARDRDEAKRKLNAMPKPELATKLRAKGGREILAAYKPTPGMGMIPMPVLIRDDTVLPTDDYLGLFRQKDRWSQVPVMLGTNRDENKIFMFTSPVWVKRWLGILPRFVEDPNIYDAVADTMARMWKATGADEPATAMVASGARDVFVYRFDWDEEPTILGSDLSRMIGAAHGLEFPFVFGHFDLGREARPLFNAANEPGRNELSAAMMSYWAAFARTGNPDRGDGKRPAWPAWSASTDYIVLDTPAGGGIRTASKTMTREAVLKGVETDPRFADPRAKCLVYHDLVAWTGTLTRYAYDTKCQAFPFDAYPWRK